MRIALAMGPLLWAACGGAKPARTAPPAPPVTTPAPAPAWYCHDSKAHDGESMSDCERTLDECKDDRRRDDEASSVASTTACAPATIAYCFGYQVSDGSHIDACMMSSDHCRTMHQFALDTAGDGDDSSAVPGSVSECVEQR